MVKVDSNVVASVIGWALGGPIGAFLANLGTDIVSSIANNKQKQFKEKYSDLSISLLVLMKLIMLADRKIQKKEKSFLKTFLVAEFGVEASEIGIKAFTKLKVPVNNKELAKICYQIVENTTYDERIQLLYILFDVANADKVITPTEEKRINNISILLKLSEQEYKTIKSMYIIERKYKNKRTYVRVKTLQIQNAYNILGISKTCTNSELKKAFRKLAVKHHPDKFAHLGKAQTELAEQKFSKILEAYELIKAKRGMK